MKSELANEHLELVTKGFLFPEPNGMVCSECGLPVGLVWEKPIGIEEGKTIPAAIWGETVTVICPVCSFHRKSA